MSNSSDWFNELTPDSGFGKAFLDFIESEENKNKIINVDKVKIFLESAKNIKNYFEQHSSMCKVEMMKVDKVLNIGQVSVQFEHLSLINSSDLRELARDASYIEFTVTSNNMPEIIFGFRDFMKELK